MLERTYTIPLRKEWLKAPAYKRAKRAISAVRKFLARHMKSEDVRILPELNMAVWADGIRSPPARVKVRTVKDDEGTVWGQVFGKKIPAVDKEEKPPVKNAAKVAKQAPPKEKESKPEEKVEQAPEKPKKSPEKPAEQAKTTEKPVKKTAKKTTKKAEQAKTTE